MVDTGPSFLSFIKVITAGIPEIIIIPITIIENLFLPIGRFPKASPTIRNNRTPRAPSIKLYFMKLIYFLKNIYITNLLTILKNKKLSIYDSFFNLSLSITLIVSKAQITPNNIPAIISDG